MLDERHVEDTLFIVLEENFRFCEEGGEPIAPDPAFKGSQDWLKQEIPAELGSGSDAQKAKLATLQAHWQTRVGVPGDHRASDSKSSELSFTTRVAKASKEECEEQVSHHLENLVRLVTAAKTEGVRRHCLVLQQ